MAAEEGSWDTTIEEWLISEGYCYAGALAQKEDGMFYAAAPVSGEAGWGFVYKEDHEEAIMQDDMSEKNMTINEASSLKATVEALKAPASGLWFGGQKYTVTQTDGAFESGDYTFQVILANRPKKGVSIFVTNSQIACAFYDEEKGQTAGNAKKACAAFAEYLAGAGY